MPRGSSTTVTSSTVRSNGLSRSSAPSSSFASTSTCRSWRLPTRSGSRWDGQVASPSRPGADADQRRARGRADGVISHPGAIRMTPIDVRSERLTAGLTDLAGTGAPDYRNDILRQVARTRQRPAWSFPERWIPMAFLTQSARACSVRCARPGSSSSSWPSRLPSSPGSRSPALACLGRRRPTRGSTAWSRCRHSSSPTRGAPTRSPGCRGLRTWTSDPTATCTS